MTQFDLEGNEVINPVSKLSVENGFGMKTMDVLEEKPKNIHYIILRIGGKIYSTTFGSDVSKMGCFASMQKVQTQGIGKENLFRIRGGDFTETNNHEKISPVGSELDIYFGLENKKCHNI